MKHLFSDSLWLLIPGTAGAVLGCAMGKAEESRRSRVIRFICGVVCAFFITEPCAAWFDISSQKVISGLAFVLGMTGMGLCLKVREAVELLSVRDLLKRFLRTGGGEE
ncbi:hypothetical protein APX81_11005 [Escherichia coli]|uniref:hypothetical protein n=1 Tax=Escherichia coli TaxID=562 RepID=UPI000BAFFC2F|nr:hypothetical protein [Escherichia coli]EAC1400290.1 hypothetical protein [Escherichia coli]PAZ25200.1 hypothetical protein APU33_13145 [Escherichia coli]PAZ32284.1 hypothetical protein APU34_02390 [Escherichia coli]PAZ33899.1 hypothetical protein APU35_22225 [Escherichia coli]PAZ40984.1 hypothetical protein APU36_07395 [Escherichia coli]